MIEKALFRLVMGNFAAGVTVVTTRGEDERPYGLTATAFTSVSLAPPLALVCIDKNAESHPHFGVSGVFAVNFLSADQQHISQRFAVSGGDKFGTVEWAPGKLGAPILAGTIGYLECRVTDAHDAGDHTIVVGKIAAAEALEGDPLVYFRGAYRRVA